MQTLIIQESKWLHGSPTASCLLDNTGNMCCLGFYAKSLGAKDKDIISCGTPSGSFLIAWHPMLFEDGVNSKFCRKIIAINDMPENKKDLDFFVSEDLYSLDTIEFLTLDMKKQRLAEMFAKMDITLEFVP